VLKPGTEDASAAYERDMKAAKTPEAREAIRKARKAHK
jgi:hypothetical protein